MRVISIEGNASSMMKSGAPLHLFPSSLFLSQMTMMSC